MASEVIVRVIRDNVTESYHRGSLAVADAQGNLWGYIGEPEATVLMRSAMAPFVAMLLVESGATQRLGIGDDELALVAGAHSGEAEQVGAVRSILSKAGLREEDLACTPSMPLHGPTALRLACQGEIPRPILCPCSGKHAGMLALCSHYSWPAQGYLAPQHPVQQLIATTVAELTGLPAERLTTAYGSCGAPTLAVPIYALATAYAKLASARSTAGAGRERSLHRVASAMRAHPRMVAGSGRFDTDLIELSQGEILSRQAGEGLQCLALTSKGLGLALKIDDGSHRPTAPAVSSLLASLGLADDQTLASLRDRHFPTVRATDGRIVAQIVPEISLKWLPPRPEP